MEGVPRNPVMDKPQMLGRAYNTKTNLPTVECDDVIDDDLDKETFLIEDDLAKQLCLCKIFVRTNHGYVQRWSLMILTSCLVGGEGRHSLRNQ